MDAAQPVRAAGRAAEQLRDLHGRDRERERAPELERAGVPDAAAHPQPALPGARRQGGHERRLGVEARHVAARGRQLQRHPPGAAAEVEQRAPAASAASCRQSGRSAAYDAHSTSCQITASSSVR